MRRKKILKKKILLRFVSFKNFSESVRTLFIRGGVLFEIVDDISFPLGVPLIGIIFPASDGLTKTLIPGPFFGIGSTNGTTGDELLQPIF